MPHGTPDWGLVGPKKTVYGLDDLGEHAVRLGSPHLWDRRGDVMILDSFEHGLGECKPDLIGLNAAVALEGGNAWHGAFCAKLTTGSDDLRLARVFYQHGHPVSSGLGLEFSFTIPEVEPEPEPTTTYWIWRIYLRNAAQEQWGEVRYDLRAWTLEYLNAGGGWTEFAPLDTGVDLENLRSSKSWNTGKLVIDYLSHTYVRFILNDLVYPLLANPFRLTAPGGAQYMQFCPTLEGQKDENQTGYLDAVVITQNEP